MFIHVVCFWLKPNTPAAAHDQLIADSKAYLGKIPEVRHLWVGQPMMTPREVVDNSYDVCLTVVLDDTAGHDAYLVAAPHKEFIERNKPHWDRVKIIDHAG
jgi:hypothetical protein